MNKNNIQEALSILHDTQALVSNSCWRDTSLEEPSFLEDMEKIQIAMCNIKGNFMYLIFDIKNFIELSEWLHESHLKNNEVIHKITIQNDQLLHHHLSFMKLVQARRNKMRRFICKSLIFLKGP